MFFFPEVCNFLVYNDDANYKGCRQNKNVSEVDVLF